MPDNVATAVCQMICAKPHYGNHDFFFQLAHGVYLSLIIIKTQISFPLKVFKNRQRKLKNNAPRYVLVPFWQFLPRLCKRPFNLHLDFWKSRYLSNLRKISGHAHLIFFSVHLSFFFSLSLGFFQVYGRDIHIECSKQFKWNLYFYGSGQSGRSGQS